MRTERKSSVAPILVCLLTALAFLLATYSGGYFWLAMRPADFSSSGDVVRVYRYRWLASVFYPAGYLERLATGHRVVMVGGDGETLHP
jgi:hypothetical protein